MELGGSVREAGGVVVGGGGGLATGAEATAVSDLLVDLKKEAATRVGCFNATVTTLVRPCVAAAANADCTSASTASAFIAASNSALANAKASFSTERDKLSARSRDSNSSK